MTRTIQTHFGIPPVLCALGLFFMASMALGQGDNANLTPEEAYRQLVAGNARYIKDATADASKLPPLSKAENRYPLATILHSSDIPVSPAVLTDLTTKDLYLVPLQLGVFTANEQDDLEYGIMNLRTPVVVVMSHYPSRDVLNFLRQYDALKAIAQTEANKVAAAKTYSGNESANKTMELYNLLGPAVARAKEAYPKLQGEELANVVSEAIAWQSLEAVIMQSSKLQDLIKTGLVNAVAAIVDDQTGRIYWLGAHPLQDEFIKSVPEEVKVNKIAENQMVQVDTLPPPVAETVVNRYITEYQTNNYYNEIAYDYYREPYYYEPYWTLFRPNVWCYRPWCGVWVRPFVPYPWHRPWGHYGWGCGFGWSGGHLNFFIGYNRHWEPFHPYNPHFRPHDPHWGHDYFRGGPGGPGGHHPPYDPVRDMIRRGDGHRLQPLDRP
ncbi:MAG: hypothetical protein Q4G59_10180, partial [Planctomycetia bacterium]|nr:hypothetical protein [Planctomycetia bacterium]